MKTKKGFSLLEVIIALTIITITFVGVSGLVSSNIKTNVLNQSYLTANYLSAEALEIVRNMRDSNWLQNFSFDASTERLWGESLWPKGGATVALKVDRSDNFDAAPWVLRRTVPSFEGNELFEIKDFNGHVGLSHTSGEKESHYARYILVEPFIDDLELNVYEGLQPLKVTAVTMFKIGKTVREVRYSTVLTDWKQGPL